MVKEKSSNQVLVDEQRKKYMDGELSHVDYYLWLGNLIGVNKNMLPVDDYKILNSRDEHFNDIPLALWDRKDPIVRHLANTKRLSWSLSDTVCTLKSLAHTIRPKVKS